MNRKASQGVFAIVCVLLGFMLVYQYKVLSKGNKKEVDYTNMDIIEELDILKNEKNELIKTNSDLLNKVKKLEENAVSEGGIEAEVKNQLDTVRIQLGIMDVEGPGISIKMSLKSGMFGDSNLEVSRVLTDMDLIQTVNTLLFSTAEAISINGYRITPQTGIKISGNKIWIGSVGQIIFWIDLTY